MVQQPSGVAGLRVLVAEDEGFQRKVLALLLRDLGAGEVLLAEDGAAALALLEGSGTAVDLLLCDLEMPGVDGFEVIAAVRAAADPRRATLPIVVLSGHRLASVVERALAAGADGFLVKPVTKGALLDQLTAACARRDQPQPP